jgi:capsular polysaccharide transport system permease protein
VTQSPPESDPAGKAKALRKQRMRQLRRKLGLGVALPTALVAIYYSLIASDRFESSALVTIQSAEMRAIGGFEGLLGSISGSSGTTEALRVRYYILSRDMLAILDERDGFSKHFQSSAADWWSRLDEDATEEERYDYYVDKVAVQHDNQSGVLTVSVQAFSPKKARAFARTILESSERFVNRLAQRIRLDRMEFAKKEVAKAETQLSESRRAILELQAKGEEFNPAQSATALLTIRGELETELAKARAELRQLRSYMRPDAAKVVALRQKVQSLASQIAREKARLVSPKKKGLNTAIARFEELMLEKEFAEKKLVSALSAMEVASLEAARQHRYLATIAAPSLPEESTHPRRWLATLKAFFLFLTLFVIGSLLLSAVREHARL